MRADMKTSLLRKECDFTAYKVKNFHFEFFPFNKV